MKKQWNNPTLSQLNLNATKLGTNATQDHDATTYDASGNWWAGGVSQNK